MNIILPVLQIKANEKYLDTSNTKYHKFYQQNYIN